MTLYRTIPGISHPVSAIGMGCWAIGGPFRYLDIQAGWGPVDDAESIRAIHAAIDHGMTVFDTAANYGTGHSEVVLGRAIQGKRDRVILATKFGFKVDEANKHVTRYERDSDIVGQVTRECEDSLRRMGVETIDLYQLHVGDCDIAVALQVREVLESLVQAGKIRTYGWSTDSVERARAFIAAGGCAAIQHDLNVVYRADEMLALCAQTGTASLNRTPLARGALSGKYHAQTVFGTTDVRTDVWTQDNILKPDFDKLDTLRQVLTRGGRTLIQGALSWVLGHSPMTLPIPGIRTVAQAEENAAALHFAPFTPDELAEIDRVLGYTPA